MKKGKRATSRPWNEIYRETAGEGERGWRIKSTTESEKKTTPREQLFKGTARLEGGAGR
jgi:hypothetical protein